jgi:hypothetical protein
MEKGADVSQAQPIQSYKLHPSTEELTVLAVILQILMVLTQSSVQIEPNNLHIFSILTKSLLVEIELIDYNFVRYGTVPYGTVPYRTVW